MTKQYLRLLPAPMFSGPCLIYGANDPADAASSITVFRFRRDLTFTIDPLSSRRTCCTSRAQCNHISLYGLVNILYRKNNVEALREAVAQCCLRTGGQTTTTSFTSACTRPHGGFTKVCRFSLSAKWKDLTFLSFEGTAVTFLSTHLLVVFLLRDSAET